MDNDLNNTNQNSVLSFPWNVQSGIEELISREWLITNGLGGYASGSLLGISTRRYHGMLTPNLSSPYGRTVMMPRLDQELIVDGESILLDGAEGADFKINAQAAKYLKEFRLEWQEPVWEFEIAGRRIRKRMVMPHRQNTTYLEYTLLSGVPIKLKFRPYVSFRPHDEAFHSPDSFRLMIHQEHHEIHFRDDGPILKMALRPQQGFFVEEQKREDVFYRVERERGLDEIESVVSPGYFETTLETNKAVAFVVSTEDWQFLQNSADSIFEAERKRLSDLLSLADKSLQTGIAAKLVLAADQFIVLPGARLGESARMQATGGHLRTVMAGYHWFTDWGRDTMISLEGLTLCTGRINEAKAILRTFANYVQNGLLPNHFPEGHRTAIYNTVDATFWYFHAIDRYYQATHDSETLKLLYPVLRSIIDHHLKGTDFGIGVDSNDGLISAAAETYQLTWMDAKVDDWVVTPRRGKPVEIQALWYNALSLMSEWTAELGEPDRDFFLKLAAQVHDTFNKRYWYEAGLYLYDVIDGPGGDDSTLRPNQIFSFSLKYPVLKKEQWPHVLDIVSEKLLTPFGLRTLDPSHKDYHHRYEGNRWARDGAYHQGLVWGWLIGPFFDAWLKVHHDVGKAGKIFDAFNDHLRSAGFGTVSEIFDADPPYAPRGCMAQAWSVAELLRALRNLQELGNKQKIDSERMEASRTK